MKGWLANVLRAEIASVHRIFQKSAHKICLHVCLCVCVCKCTNVPGRVERRDGLWQIHVCQLANLDFTINVTVHHTKAFSEHQLCYTQTHSYIYIHLYTSIYIHTSIYIYKLAAFSQAGLSYAMHHWNNGKGRVSPNLISKAFFSNNWFD